GRLSDPAQAHDQDRLDGRVGLLRQGLTQPIRREFRVGQTRQRHGRCGSDRCIGIGLQDLRQQCGRRFALPLKAADHSHDGGSIARILALGLEHRGQRGQR
ncbi:hypothetical protein RZS08_67400, partial [Arthrospira platensis SPKY1]|nr:hypothetical protein [Arthrospira platensis SPKY1]